MAMGSNTNLLKIILKMFVAIYLSNDLYSDISIDLDEQEEFLSYYNQLSCESIGGKLRARLTEAVKNTKLHPTEIANE